MFRGGCLARSAAPARAVLATSQTPALRPFRNQSAVCPAPFPAAAPAVFSLSDECEIRLGSATTLRRSPRALAAPRRYPLPSPRCSARREKRPNKAAASASEAAALLGRFSRRALQRGDGSGYRRGAARARGDRRSVVALPSRISHSSESEKTAGAAAGNGAGQTAD